MTAAQQARTEGFLASLSVRGVSLSFGASNFTALVQPLDPEGMEFNTGKSERRMSRVVALRQHVAAFIADIKPGATLLQPGSIDEGVIRHRITEVHVTPSEPVVAFVCEQSIGEV